ncbi:MAG: hypothetical protein ABJL67_07885 [Sulfitobacter sp.]
MATADILLLGRFAPNYRKREMAGRHAIDFQQRMSNPELRRAFTEKFTPLPPGTDVDGFATVVAEMIMSAAAKIAPRAKHSQRPAGWCAREGTKGGNVHGLPRETIRDRAFAHRSKQQQLQRGLESSWETP